MASGRNSQQNARCRKQPSYYVILLCTGCFLLLLAVAVARLFSVQILQAKTLAQKAENQRITQTVTAAQRGTIYDRQGNVLAKSALVYNISADPTLITEKQAVAKLLAQTFGGKADSYLPLLGRKNHYVLLAKKVDPDAVAAFRKSVQLTSDDSDQAKKLKREMQTIAFTQDYKRVYPAGTVAAQIVGFVNSDGKGVAGVEMRYDRILRGTPGVSFSERDQAGNPIPSGIQKTINPKQGRDIILTVDSEIAYYAQKQLDAAVKAQEAKTGAVVVMSPKTGEIYAACSSPTFDPNNLKSTTNDAIRNRALVDLYEPGSTFKTVTLAGGLQAGVVTPTTEFSVPYSLQIGDHLVKDADLHDTENMTVTDIIRKSSNIGATRIADKMGADAFYRNLVDFGLDQDPGVDFPGSAKGYLAPKDRWSKILLSNASFGQGVSLTPVSLTRCVSVIANGGTLVTPHLLADVPSDPAARPDWTRQSRRILDEAVSRQATEILKGVITEDHLMVPGYVTAGKSGTAQIAEQGKGYATDKYASSFIGYLPADDPQLICLVVIFEPGKENYYGAAVAGPTYADILHYAAGRLNIAPAAGTGQSATSGSGVAGGGDHD
ncbi:MAG: penicillin-binding protein 2 [Actinomycetia bacterium]|nr:penicillin-binding protein 2 [Actinomycetes bacterium]